MSENRMSNKFKILAIDGGGFRGAYSAHLLKRIEEEFAINWLSDFNLLAGTSTGAIIAAGLAIGIPAKEIRDLYEKHGCEIFKRSLIPRLGLFSSKYKNSGLRSILVSFFGKTTLGDIEIPLIIPATDIGNGCVHVFKSTYHNEFFRDKDVLVSEAVLASCSAPTFFPPTLITGDQLYLLADGGLWANNPSLVAAIDAKKRLNAKLEDLQILSIGTGKANHFYHIKNFKNRRFFGWGFATKWGRGKIIEMQFSLQSQNANNMLGLLLERDQILRLNFESEKKLPIDAPEEFDDLVTRADREFTHSSVTIRDFLNKEIENGNEIKEYAKTQGMKKPVEEGRRCWTVKYVDESHFHMDVLPAIPNSESFRLLLAKHLVSSDWTDDAIGITDNTLPNYTDRNAKWPVSNPKGYSDWFMTQMSVVSSTIYKQSTVLVAKYPSIEDVPSFRLKTPLQRVVQVMKYHRDLMYGDDSDKPISIIITTLVAHAYNNEENMYDALSNVVNNMMSFIKDREGVRWVENPTNPLENFADKWLQHPNREENFYKWHKTIKACVQELADGASGLDSISESITNIVGEHVSKRVMIRYGNIVQEARIKKSLKASKGAATLGASGATIKEHTFYGKEIF